MAGENLPRFLVPSNLAMRSSSRLVSISSGLLILAHGAQASAQTHTRVDVGGFCLDVLRAGSGSPAVVFEVGLADSLDTWAPLVPAIAKLSTAIAYSRAGFGRSDVGSSDHSAPRAV